MEDTKPEQAIFCSYARLQVEGFDHQCRHKTFDQQLVLPAGQDLSLQDLF